MTKKGFIFGVGTSALQIEENPMHDWSGLVANDGSRLEKNVEHLANWETDYKLVKELGVDTYRTSIDWARLQEKPFGRLEPLAVEQYHRMFDFLKTNSVDLTLTLHHFANPTWFSDKDGWAKKENIGMFLDFARKAADEFGEYASRIITINEISSYVSLAYLEGFSPPKGKNELRSALKAIHNMGAAHRDAYLELKERHPEKEIGFSEVSRPIVSYNGTLPEKIQTSFLDKMVNQYIWNVLMMDNDSAIPCADYIGMNYYGPAALDLKDRKDPVRFRPGREHDDLWEVNPKLMIEMAENLHRRYNRLPVFIMENGTCTNDDSLRIKFLREHLEAIDKARSEGKDFIKGYVYWSLLDNFELNRGMNYRFGLVEVNPETMQRNPKPSFYAYKEEIEKRKERI